MALVLKSIINGYLSVEKIKDYRVDAYPLTSPLSIACIIFSYLYFVKKCGPAFMQNRPAFQLNSLVMFYNVVQVVLNSSLALYAAYTLYLMKANISMYCVSSNVTRTYMGDRTVIGTYVYFLLKLLDLVDTIFFVLRKKSAQISFLHVYHHVLVILGTYLVLIFAPGGQYLLVGVLNSFIHVLMYAYYFVTAYNPKLREIQYYKKFVTQAQIIQFVIFVIHFARPLLYGSCDYPKVLLFIGFGQNIFLLCLFIDFYLRAYTLKKPKIN